MNTPRTKAPKRYKPSGKPPTPAETYDSGITNERILKLVGGVITIFPQVEEQIIPVFAELIGLDTDKLGDARLIFRSIINHNTRIHIMKAMLEKAPQHQHTSEAFDKLIDDFNGLAKMRNNYAHGLWTTRRADSRVFVENEVSADEADSRIREVTEAELKTVGAKMDALLSDLLKPHWTRGNRARARALTLSLETKIQQGK